jgi:uncharacterized repeat protein (TIGR01451 family)
MTDASGLAQSQQFCVQVLPKAGPPAGQSNLGLTVRASGNPVKINNEMAYIITITNGGTNPERQVRLTATIPGSLQLLAAPSGPTDVENTDPPRIRLKPILELRPGESQSYTFRFRAAHAGPAQITAEVTSQSQLQPLTKSEAVSIIEQ